jgi:hypothetical protein
LLVNDNERARRKIPAAFAKLYPFMVAFRCGLITEQKGATRRTLVAGTAKRLHKKHAKPRRVGARLEWPCEKN